MKNQHRKSNAFLHSIFIAVSILAYTAKAGRIIGTVRSAQSLKPITEVQVSIEETEKETATDSAGDYSFDSISPGTYTLLFSGKGFEPLIRTDVYVAGKASKRVDVELMHRILKLDKMVVRGQAFQKPSDMSSSTKIMNLDEILRAPGALVDVQRVVQNLPSVASGGDNVNEVVVRGATPGENLLIMDNIEIPNPNHFAQQGSGGGVVSLINPLLVKGLTFNAGAPPAQYGHKASSVIDVDLRDGNDKMVLGGIDIGLAGAGGHIEGPLWPEATFMASAHRSYLDLIASLQPTIAIPRFWGGQTKLTQHIGAHKLYANGIFGRNDITIRDSKSELGLDYDIVESGGIIYATGGTWDGYWGENFSSNITVSATGNTFDRLTYSPSNSDTGFCNNSRQQEQTVKIRAAGFLENGTKISAGGYGRRCDFDIDIKEYPDTLKKYDYNVKEGSYRFESFELDSAGKPILLSRSFRRSAVGYKYGGFISIIVHLFNRLRFVPGIRLDGFEYIGDISVSPRLSAIYSVAPPLDITVAFGVQHQYPDYVDVVAHESNKKMNPMRAITGIGGIEYTFSDIKTKCMVEGYYKRYTDMPIEARIAEADSSVAARFMESNRLYSKATGHSFGVELFAQKKLTKQFFATAAWSISRSLYEDPRPGGEGKYYDGNFDFRQGVTLTGGWKLELLEKHWYKRLHKKLWFRILSPVMPVADRMEFSGKWRYLGGRPYTRHMYDSTYRRWYINTSKDLNTQRYDPYHRMDFRFERRYGFGFLHMIYYFDFQNIYNRKNVWMYMYPEGKNEKQPIYQLPFFPVGGIIIGF